MKAAWRQSLDGFTSSPGPLKRTGLYGFPERAFGGCEPVRFNSSIDKEVLFKRTKRGKSGARFHPVRARTFQGPGTFGFVRRFANEL